MKILPKRRRLEGKTNYVKRRRLLEEGKPRIVIRKSNRYITIQFIESRAAQDAVKFQVVSKKLMEYGWPKDKEGSLKSLGASYLAGLLFGKILIDNKVRKAAILDTGLIRSTPGSKIYSALKGIKESGYEMSFNEEVFPSEERIKNENVKIFLDKVKENIVKSSGGKK